MRPPRSSSASATDASHAAYNEASFALIRMLQTYDTIALAPDVQPPESMFNGDEVLLISQITIMFSGGLWARFGRASM